MFRLALASPVLAAAFAAAAPAAPIDLVTYTFPATNEKETGVGYAALTAPDVSATDMGDTSGKVKTFIQNLGYASAPVLSVDPEGATAFAPDTYFGFTVSPVAPGTTLNLDSLVLDAARGGGSARGFAIRSSADGFAADLPVNPNPTAIGTQRPNLTTFTVDLSGANLDAVTAPLEFRIYVFSNGATLTIDFDNVALRGEVVPEPGSMSLLALGSLCLLVRGR